MAGGFAARAAYLVGSGVQFLLRPSDQSYAGAILRVPTRNREVDPTSTTGDDRGLAIEQLFSENFRHARSIRTRRIAPVALRTAKPITKDGFMKRTLIVCALAAMIIGCTAAVSTRSGSSSDATEGSLMQADRDFAAATHARGIDGWMSFYAPDAIRIRYRGNMVKGFDEIRRFDLPYISDTTSVLNWEPTDAHVFRGGDIGSTTGRYWAVSRVGPDTGKEISHGRYVTMWRRNGARWLVIMDTGYPEPVATAR
jgi:ketosteroid isomerase-like protein